MADEYISKQRAIDRIASCYCMDCEHSNGILCGACEHQDDMDLIDDMPAADVKTEIHAYWIRGKEFGFRTHNPMWYCSNCGGGIRYNTTLRTYEKHKKPVEEVNCFCRKCGAKMDLEPIYEREEN